MVKLKNGAEEAEPVVRLVMLSLNDLLPKAPTVFYDLVMMCRDRGYKAWSDMGPARDCALIALDGDIHDSIRNTILSGVVGDGLAMALVNPIAQ